MARPFHRFRSDSMERGSHSNHSAWVYVWLISGENNMCAFVSLFVPKRILPCQGCGCGAINLKSVYSIWLKCHQSPRRWWRRQRRRRCYYSCCRGRMFFNQIIRMQSVIVHTQSSFMHIESTYTLLDTHVFKCTDCEHIRLINISNSTNTERYNVCGANVQNKESLNSRPLNQCQSKNEREK